MSHKENGEVERIDLSTWFEGYENLPRDVALYLAAARSVLEVEDFPTSARVVFDACKEMTGATAGYVALLSEDGAENEVLFLDAGGLPCTVDPELPMPIRGLRSESYRLNKAVYDNDFMNSQWVDFMPTGHVVMRNVMFSPLVIDGKAVGLIGLANKDGDFTDHDAAVATGFGELGALALRNAQNLERIREGRETAERYLQIAPAIILGLDREGHISLLNRTGGEILGIDPAEAVGLDWFGNFLADGDAPAIHAVFEQMLDEGVDGRETVEAQVKTTQGELRTIIWHNSMLTGPDGGVQGTLSSGHDITEQRKLEQAMIEAQRLETLEILARGVAHEINNPLMGMMNYAELIESADVPERCKEAASEIVSEGKRIAQLTHSLLAFATSEPTEEREVMVSRIVDRAVSLARPLSVGLGVSITVWIDESIPSLYCNPSLCSRALLDVLVNALDAFRSDDRPDGDTDRTIEVTSQLVQGEQSGLELVRITIRDNGPGIRAEDLERSQTPFFTTRERSERRGLGLASVRGTVRQHGGTLAIASTPGEGTVVTIELPLA